MATVVDFSYGHAQITPAAMRKVDGCIGGVGYAGCNDNGKNITRAELNALLDAGFIMALVIENQIDDLKSRAAGVAQGNAIVAAAKSLGYDWRNCVLFTGYDTNATSGDYAGIYAGMQGFASVVPVPGYYGDSDSMAYMHSRGGVAWHYWQSNSTSFSPDNPGPFDHLLQKFNDPRAHGLPVDVNNVLKQPLGFMGEDVALTDDDKAWIKAQIAAVPDAVWGDDVIPVDPTNTANPNWRPTSVLPDIRNHAISADSQSARAVSALGAIASQIAALQTALNGVAASIAQLSNGTPAAVDLSGASFPATITVAPKAQQ